MILTPHIGGSTAGTQENIGFEVAGKFVKYSDNGSTLSSVNFPEFLYQNTSVQNVYFIHENRPGVLNKLEPNFRRSQSQYCSAISANRSKVVYVVVDVETDDASPFVNAKLREIEGQLKHVCCINVKIKQKLTTCAGCKQNGQSKLFYFCPFLLTVCS